MSNYLTKPYEISLWKDGPNGEEKICTIGTDTMEGQNRAFEPIFSRNVNGVKKLSFKIYKKYVDTQTGEEVDNPYVPYLISERKVKLHLLEEPSNNEWHDFIIKNVSENSATHLCTYQLEDALVQELSKNGFGVTLDAKLMNNIGTANKLAEFVLRETDWDVSENSEAFVQTVDEALVYLTFPQNPTGLKVYKITGQKEGNRKIGVTANELGSLDALKGKTILAFYSSCTGKPHRFQFLYSENGVYNTEEELKNYISNETDYQYYIDFNNPEDDYIVKNSNYTLPIGFATTTHVEYENGTATTLSSKYRGRRYGFSQQAKYIPVLDRYVQLYNKVNEQGNIITEEITIDGETKIEPVIYYGYEHAEYKSPALTQNMISNSTFESTSGWTGTKSGASGDKAKVESVYGYFGQNGFVNAIDELKNGTFDPEKKTYKSYLKLNFDGANSTVINSGPFDNRTLIGNMVAGDEWALWSKVIGPGTLNFTIGEYKYFSSIDGYDNISGEISFSNTIKTETKNNKTYSVYTVETSSSSKESFKKNMNVRLKITASTPGEYYLEEIELFKVARYNNTIIPLEEQADSLEDRTVEKTYYYFTDDALNGITNAEQLIPEATAKTLSYTTYKPVYNEGAQKVRTVTAKESNYFNILQSIAETFEAWLTFDITRVDGGITSKKIAFKNYVGGDNYACFRYGVNLKDVQRTFESKNIVTKLIVKNNSNEHADGGFCTIQRANANPTGENYIYDFQYFFNQGLINDRDYLDTLYVIDGAQGPDSVIWTSGVGNGTLNLQGYFPRIKALNNKIQAESELLANIAQDLTKYKADLAVAEAGLDAATSGIEEVGEDFLLLTGVTIDMLSGHTISSVQVGIKQDSEDAAKENGGWFYTNRDWVDSVSVTSSDDKKSINVVVSITGDTSDSERSLYVKVYPTISLSKNGNTATLSQYYNIKCTIAAKATSGSGSVDIEVVNSSRNDVQKKLQEYAAYVANEKKYIPEKATLQTQVDALEAQYNTKQKYIEDNLKYWKRLLNQLFFQTYSRFIQEGTWISEEYVDDGLYYADAQSVMYNSCYPQVAYTINVISVEGLPGYEDFKYKLGEKTWVVDPDFFGDEDKEPVIITEIVENLDDKSKNQIKVQNFKNQFQDLFQKITATVQQAQYSTGSYEKAVALAEANQERKQQFLTDALDSASARLTTAGQQSVTWGNDGITVKSVNSPNDAIRMVGGAILLSKQDKNGQQKWVTGVTSDGVSASLITAGVLNAGEISIMNYDEPVFRWDAFGISAYDATWYNGGADVGTVISGVNTKKFVRFDKHGIYGINDADVDGANWYPQDSNEIDNKATFALTWEGFKVTNGNGVTMRIGDNAKVDGLTNNNLIDVRRGNIPIFSVDENGSFVWSTESSPTRALYAKTKLSTPSGSYNNFPESNADSDDASTTNIDETNQWHKNKTNEDYYVSYSYDGGSTWGEAIQVQGADGKDGIDGYTPIKGVDYFDGSNGQDGTSIVWKGEFDRAPSNPQNGWAYYNSSAKASYTYRDGSWYQMSIDGVDGQDGANGVSIEWKGELDSPPTSPQINWVYKDIDDGKVYIYNGAGWELMVLDGTDGQDGANGTDGLSVFITYNNSTEKPQKPIGAGNTNGWHTEATSDSVWISQKIAASATVGAWGEPIKIKGSDGKDGTDGKDANVTYENIWKAFDDATDYGDKKGIFTFVPTEGEMANKNCLGINADVIQTGALRVGTPSDDTGKPWKNAKFYADIDGNTGVYIAGWQVNADRLTNGTIGASGSFGVYPAGITSGLNGSFAGTLPTGDAWVMTAGTNFGVTKNGYLFANSGKIGNMDIGAVANSTENFVGRNLLLQSQSPTITNEGIKQYECSEPLEPNKQYTISFKVNHDFDYDCYVFLKYDSNPAVVFEVVEGQYLYQFTFDTSEQDITSVLIGIYDGSSNPTNSAIEWAKLEKGTVATPWSPAPEDSVQANVSNDFSWKFSPTEGMFMWNGRQPTSPTNTKTKDAIFAIYDNRASGATTPKYELFVKGHIEATSGKIGGWEIFNDATNGTTITNNKNLSTGNYMTKGDFSLSKNGLTFYELEGSDNYRYKTSIGSGIKIEGISGTSAAGDFLALSGNSIYFGKKAAEITTYTGTGTIWVKNNIYTGNLSASQIDLRSDQNATGAITGLKSINGTNVDTTTFTIIGCKSGLAVTRQYYTFHITNGMLTSVTTSDF